MPLIETRDSDIRPEDLTLDFFLEAFPIRTPLDGVKMDGKESYRIDAYNSNLGFGITNIEIDLKPNLQPIIVITFKDLYGNLIFNNNAGFNYSVLFDLPYPKFRLFIKGYVGKGISFLLHVKSVKTAFVPSDGSYELKAEFVPNIFGFFADIPYQFLFAVPQLKGGNSQDSIIEIAKNGAEVRTRIRQTQDQYLSIKNTLEILLKSPEEIGRAYNSGELDFREIQGDTNLTKENFKNIEFNIDNINPKTNLPFRGIKTDSLVIFGRLILASINSPTKYSFANPERSIDQKLIDNAVSILQENLKIVKDVSFNQGVNNTIELKIESQSIFNVMTRLAGDCAYILGYILEGGIRGFDADNNRVENEEIIGLYYPLKEETDKQVLALQVPYPQATTEIAYVENFVKALYQGKLEAQTAIEQSQASPSTPVQQNFIQDELVFKLTNAEFGKKSPYLPEASNIISNIIQRAGILTAGYQGWYSYDNLGFIGRQSFDAEFANMEKALYDIRDSGSKLNKTVLKNFCEEVINFSSYKGELKKSFDDKTKSSASKSYKQYFESYLNNLPKSNDKSQFSGNTASSLQCLWTKNNDIVYYSPKTLIQSFAAKSPSANNIITNSPSEPEILCIVFPANHKQELDPIIDNLVGDDRNLDSKIPVQNTKEFFKWYSGLNFSEQSKTIYVDYANLSVPIIDVKNDLITDYKDQPGKLIVNCAIFKLLDSRTVKFKPKEFIIDFYDKYYRACLYQLCSKILPIVKKSDNELEQLANKYNQNNQNTIVVNNTEKLEVYRRDQDEVNSVYVQFHHICQAWISLANINNQGSLPSAFNLAQELENTYKNVDRNNNFYLNFDFPLVSEYNPNIDVKNSIVNTEPLLENNNQTSTLNMMQNICQLNNFLLQPIPGGIIDDMEGLFNPRPVFDPKESIGKNAFSFIWSPTPENRYGDNQGQPLYPEKGFLDRINSLINKPIAALRYGDPNNVIVKTIKAGADDNKITAESIQASGDIANNNNQNKKNGFDCSMLAIMQGRSYRISVEIIGNAQIFPTMYFGIEGLPIFTGLYWITNVQHKITPNNMETLVEGVKMKFNGSKFVAITPVTKQSSSKVIVSSNNPGKDKFFSGDLNYSLLQNLKNVKIKNVADLDDIIKVYTSDKYSSFTNWFDSEIAGKKQFYNGKINVENFNNFWNDSITAIWENYGDNGINFLELVSIHAVVYGETQEKYEFIGGSGNKEDDNGMSLSEIFLDNLLKEVFTDSVTSPIGNSTFQYITNLSDPKSLLIQKVNNIAERIKPTDKVYRDTHFARVGIILDTLYPQGINVFQSISISKNNTNSNNKNNNGGGDCSDPLPLIDQNSAKAKTTRERNVGTVAGIKFSDIKAKNQKYIFEEVGPILESEPEFKNLAKGLKALIIIQGIVEGYYPGSRAYTTKNPGNIGNTDSGANSFAEKLKIGVENQKIYIESAAYGKTSKFGNGYIFGEKKRNNYFSPELNQCVPGFKINYQGELGYYLWLYATGTRYKNNYLEAVLTFLKYNGIDANANTKISSIINSK